MVVIATSTIKTLNIIIMYLLPSVRVDISIIILSLYGKLRTVFTGTIVNCSLEDYGEYPLVSMTATD